METIGIALTPPKSAIALGFGYFGSPSQAQASALLRLRVYRVKG